MMFVRLAFENVVSQTAMRVRLLVRQPIFTGMWP
jgi:hypothetical protein